MMTTTLYRAPRLNRSQFDLVVGLAGFNQEECELVGRAYRFSKYGHRNQFRSTGERYFEHPKAVCVTLLACAVKDAHVLSAALLHDILEDSFILTEEDVRHWFDPLVHRYVFLVTKKPGIAEELYFTALSESNEPGAWLVKCADRLHNLSTLPSSEDPDKQVACNRKKWSR